MKLSYITVFTNSFDEAVQWFEKLGLRIISNNGDFAMVETGTETKLNLHRSRASVSQAQLHFEHDNVDRFLQETDGVSASGPEDTPWGHRVVHFDFPKDFVVELFSKLHREDK